MAWLVADGGSRFRDWVASAPSTPGPKQSTGASTPESARGSSKGSSKGSSTGSPSAPASGAGGGAPEASQPSSTAPGTPRAEPYPLQRLDAKTSLSFNKPVQRSDRKGDIRFNCEEVGCELESDTSVFMQMFGSSGTSLDECRLFLNSAKKRSWTLASMANGSEICVKHSSGDIALLTIQTKSTAVPELAFLQLDMTIWRAD
jgi:hypothetical protein